MKANLVNITELRDTERRVLNYMLLSKENFTEIGNRLDKNDFIFSVHRIMFEYFTTVFKRLLLFYMDNNNGNEMQQVLQDYSEFVAMVHNSRTIETFLRFAYKIQDTQVLEELAKAPSTDIEADIAIIKDYSFEKAIGKKSNKSGADIEIDTKDGITILTYKENRLIGIVSTNLNNIPTEACNRLKDTMEMIYELDTKSGSNELKILFYDDKKEYINSVLLSKDIITD